MGKRSSHPRPAGKYNNRIIWYQGIKFDSQKERDRYIELEFLQRAGKIRDLQLQVKYELIPAQYENGKCVERACVYYADFDYYERRGDNSFTHIVEDVKGYRDPKSAAYAKFVIKRKLMRQIYNIAVREV